MCRCSGWCQAEQQATAGPALGRRVRRGDRARAGDGDRARLGAQGGAAAGGRVVLQLLGAAAAAGRPRLLTPSTRSRPASRWRGCAKGSSSPDIKRGSEAATRGSAGGRRCRHEPCRRRNLPAGGGGGTAPQGPPTQPAAEAPQRTRCPPAPLAGLCPPSAPALTWISHLFPPSSVFHCRTPSRCTPGPNSQLHLSAFSLNLPSNQALRRGSLTTCARRGGVARRRQGPGRQGALLPLAALPLRRCRGEAPRRSPPLSRAPVWRRCRPPRGCR
jgi:hypothetical protein